MIDHAARTIAAIGDRLGIGADLLHRMLSGTALSGVASALTQVPLLILTWAVARVSGESGLGDFAVMTGLAAALASFLQFGTGYGTTCLVARHATDAPRLAAAHATLAAVIVGSLTIVGAGIFLAVRGPIVAGWMERPDLVPLALPTALLLAGLAVSFPLQGVLIGLGAVRGWVLGSLVGGLALTGLAVVVLRGLPLPTVLVIYAAITWAQVAVLAAAATGALRSRCGGWTRPDAPSRREFLHFIAPLGLSGIFMQPIAWVVLAWLFRQEGGPAQVGLFNAAITLRAIALFIPSQANRIGSAIVAARAVRPDALRAGVRVNALVAVGGFLLVALPLAAGASWAMGVFGPGFESGAGVLLVLLAAGALDVVAQSLFQRVQAAGRMWRSLLLIVIPREGTLLAAGALLGSTALGLAWATLLSMAFGMVACAAVGRRAISPTADGSRSPRSADEAT